VNGQGFIMSFQWDSPAFRVSGAPGSQNDMDVYLFNAAKNQVVAGSVIPQAITRDPIEVFAFVNNTGVTADFNIMLVKLSGANPNLLKYVLFSFGGTIQEFATNSSTILAMQMQRARKPSELRRISIRLRSESSRQS
jgi:hypothetical protein